MLTYDAMGNPLTYFNGKKSWNFTWKYGRQLASATDGTHTITNTYDVDGVRESKTVDGVEHKYVTLDGKIIREMRCYSKIVTQIVIKMIYFNKESEGVTNVKTAKF